MDFIASVSLQPSHGAVPAFSLTRYPTSHHAPPTTRRRDSVTRRTPPVDHCGQVSRSVNGSLTGSEHHRSRSEDTASGCVVKPSLSVAHDASSPRRDRAPASSATSHQSLTGEGPNHDESLPRCGGQVRRSRRGMRQPSVKRTRLYMPPLPCHASIRPQIFHVTVARALRSPMERPPNRAWSHVDAFTLVGPAMKKRNSSRTESNVSDPSPIVTVGMQ